MQKFLVTGGAGFIGSNICEKLLEMGHCVRVLDNFSTGKEENIRDFLGSVELQRGDIRDKAVLKKAVSGVGYVIHLAALGSVARSVDDPETTHEVNATGTLNVLKASREAGIKKVVCASSSSVYGNTPVLPKEEGMFPQPRSPYAASKLACEHYCRVFYESYGLETVALRYFNVYGKKQDPDSQYAAVIPRFVSSLIRNERPVIYGDGEHTRDFTFVEDCAQATIKSCFAEGCAGAVMNVGYGGRTSIKQLFLKIRDRINSDIEPVFAPPRTGDVRDSLAAISRASQLVGYIPEFDIDRGIGKTVEWYLGRE